jgi:dienelactone hydrolase
MDRHAWDGLIPDLTGAGFHVLTFDQRGFGATGGQAQNEKVAGDTDAVYAWLVSRKDVDASRVVAGGASCGVTWSGDLAIRHRDLKALLLLSGGVTDAARAHFAATPALAIFGAAAPSRSDVDDIRQAVAASKHPSSTTKVYRTGGHGVTMFDANPDLKPAIVSWLQAVTR